MKKLFISIIASIIALWTHAQVQCEDTCQHVHGIDLSHYQGNVFWETVGDNSKMAYVYLKATEGGTNIHSKYKQNIDLAHTVIGLKVGYISLSTYTYPTADPAGKFYGSMPPGRPGSLAYDRRGDQKWYGNREILRLTLQVPASRRKGIQSRNPSSIRVPTSTTIISW